jgi:hypothetical protein
MTFYSSLADTSMEKFSHNNMVPFFGSGITQNLNESMNQTLLEKYTGYDNTTHIEKMEQTNFSDIQKNVYTHENSQGYLVEFDRMEASPFHNNILPAEQVKVGPGTKFTDPVSSSGGFQQDSFRDIGYYKDIDDLRVKTNPKETFEGRLVDGIKETKRGKIGKIDKNRVDTYYEQTEDNLFKTTGAYLKEKSRPCIDVKDTNRKNVREYQGVAHKNIGTIKYGTVKESTKQNLENFGDRNVQITQEGKGINYDYGKKNILVYNNERDVTTTKTYEGNVTSYIKSTIAPFTDIFKRTNKEFFVQNAREFGQMQSTLPNKQTVYNPNDTARTTIKETLVEDTRTGHLKGYEQITTYDPNDVARTTIKETLIHDTKLGNLNTTTKSVVYNPNEIAKQTIRETLDDSDGTINLKGHNMQTVNNPNNVAKTTIKETTIDNDILGIVSNQNKGGGHITNKYNAKHTNKEITSDNEYMGNPDQENSDGYRNASFDAKITNKQITSDKDYYGAAGNENEAMMSYENIYNAVINQTKEDLLTKPAPTQTGVKLSIGKEFVNLTNIKIPCNKNDNGAIISKIYQEPPSTQFINITQEKNNLNIDETSKDRLNPDLLKAFKENPYTHSLNNAV